MIKAFKHLVLILVLCLFYNVLLYCQLDADYQIDRIKFVSDSLYNIKEFSKAENIYIEAEEHLRSSNDWENWFLIISYIRMRLRRDGNFIELGKVLNKYEKFIPEKEKTIRAKLLFQKGYNYLSLSDNYNSIKEFKKSLQFFNSIINQSTIIKKYVYSIYDNLSINYSRLGDQKSAIKYSDYAMKFCTENDLNDKFCYLHINKGQFLFYDKRPDSAIDQYYKSLEYCNSSQSKAFAYVSIAELLLDQNKLKESKAHLDSAANFDIVENEFYYTIFSSYLFEIGEFELGKNALNQTFIILNKIYDNKNLIKELTKFSLLLYDRRDKEEALKYAHQALCVFYSDLNENDTKSRPIENNIIPYTYVIEALNIKARYFRDKYLDTKDEFSLGEATFYYDLLLSHFDKLKSEYYSSSSQYRMGAYSQKIYSEVINFFVDQYKVSQKVADFENAFSLAQRANSFVLRNAVSDRKALEMADVSQDSLEQYLFLASKASSESKVDTSGNGAEVLLEFDAFKESLLSNYPSYGKYDKEEEILVAEIQSALDENSILIKYYYFNEVLTVFGITKESTFAENLPFPNGMDSLVNSNLEIISQNQNNDSLANMYLINSKKIYNLVLGSLLEKYELNDNIDHLIVIPDGPLKKVPFNALSINDSDDWNNPNSFLMSKYAVNYLYYCSQLKDVDKPYRSKNGFIGFGIEYEDDFLKEIIRDYISSFKDGKTNTRTISLSPLKYADDEVITTAEILDGIPFVNSEVTPSHVYATINNYDVIHFSAHAFVDEKDYLNSFVVLNKDEGENYQLKYSDILNLDIDSEMVVLSACQTGSGKSVVGEGLMSLSRAFVQSGSDAAVGAYWNAPDYATKELMTLFYSNLKEGMSKSKAMQQAQIKYLTNDNISSPTIRSPFFWASWAVYGDDQPLRMSKSFFDFSSWTSYLILALAALLIFFLAKFLWRKI